jgi:hypothetical protein
VGAPFVDGPRQPVNASTVPAIRRREPKNGTRGPVNASVNPRAGARRARGARASDALWPGVSPLAELRQTAKLAAAKKEADEETREEELDRRRKTAAPVPAMEAMTREELAPARPRETKDVLEVWRRGSERACHRGIERSAHRGEEQDCGDARADLEAAVGDVTVRHPIADEVEEQSEWQRAEPRTNERAAGSTGRNMKGGDQAASLASRCRLSAHLRPD